ncbi:MAG: hypothetical protein WC334_05370 [Kiritimatiellales bacterium]
MRKNMWICLLGIVTLNTVFAQTREDRFARARATIQVRDQDGILVPDARVGGWFLDTHHPQEGRLVDGATDTNGCCVLEEDTSGRLSCTVQKDGYYLTRDDYKNWYVSWRPNDTHIENRRWQPWNPTLNVVLKKIKNPIPMYAKNLNLGVPEFKKQLGFDLEKGDWVAPYGKGVASDFVFYATLDERGPRDSDYSLLLTFPNEKDGIQTFEGPVLLEGSQLWSGYMAPESGYLSEWKQFQKRRPETGRTNNVDRNRKYYFRIRTKLDEQGNIISAQYGKIYGDFLNFTYYLNPTSNDRNVEFDPEKNLLDPNDRFAP